MDNTGQYEYNIEKVLKTLICINDNDWLLLYPNATYRASDLIFHSAFPISPIHMRP